MYVLGTDSTVYSLDARFPNDSNRYSNSRHSQFLNNSFYSRICASPDGNFVATGSRSGGSVWVWNVRDREAEPIRLKGHDEKLEISGVAWTHDMVRLTLDQSWPNLWSLYDSWHHVRTTKPPESGEPIAESPKNFNRTNAPKPIIGQRLVDNPLLDPLWVKGKNHQV